MPKKIPTILTLAVVCFQLATAQPTWQKGYVIKGHIHGIENGTKVYLHDIDAQVKIDSSVSVDGNFSLKGYVKRPTICWLECKDQYATIDVENVEMEFESPLQDMFLYHRAKGGKEQGLRNELEAMQHRYDVVYLAAYDSINKQQYSNNEHRKQLVQTLNDYQDTSQIIYVVFGKTHPNSFIGLDILYRNRQRISKDTLETLLAQMDGEIRSTDKAQALVTYVYGELAQKGKPFIDFEAETADGASFKLSSLKGNYILLSFWNAACVPCRIENKKISQDYNRFKNKLAIVSFSTDKNKSTWLKASKDDNILWTNVSDLKGDNGKIKTQYDVQAIPAAYLIDKDGVVVEKFIGLDDDFLRRLEKVVGNE